MSDSIKEILAITPENMAEKQEIALRNHAIRLLKDIILLLEEKQYEEIEIHLSFSGAGDGWGSDNKFINFQIDFDNKEGELDISNIAARLIELRDFNKNNEEK